ncbi:MAG: hypothetical protein MHM6MM_003519 [Cercozoa sp. M6MM]
MFSHPFVYSCIVALIICSDAKNREKKAARGSILTKIQDAGRIKELASLGAFSPKAVDELKETARLAPGYRCER